MGHIRTTLQALPGQRGAIARITGASRRIRDLLLPCRGPVRTRHRQPSDHLTYHPPPTPPRGRTWAPVVPTTAQGGTRTGHSPAHSPGRVAHLCHPGSRASAFRPRRPTCPPGATGECAQGGQPARRGILGVTLPRRSAPFHCSSDGRDREGGSMGRAGGASVWRHD